MKNVENKWIGWVEDSEGYMVRFIGPTSETEAGRSVREIQSGLGSDVGEGTWADLGYALRTKFVNFVHTNIRTASSERYYSRLPIADLNALINVVRPSRT